MLSSFLTLVISLGFLTPSFSQTNNTTQSPTPKKEMTLEEFEEAQKAAKKAKRTQQIENAKESAKKTGGEIKEAAKDAAAKAEEAVKDTAQAAKEISQEIKNESLSIRESSGYGAFVNYSLLDLLVPSKYGISAYKKFERFHLEAEYLTGSMSVPAIITDIGSVSDQRFTVRLRNFRENSNFNWYWGVAYYAFDAHIGSEYLASVSPGSQGDYDVARHRALGLEGGLGHRWHFANNFAFGVDWIAWSQPLTTLQKSIPFLEASNNQSYRDTLEKALNTVAYVPRIYVLKLSLGYVF